ncbi:hypothetical protein FNAPI_2075 [Fusarium napiforme]|uniref:Uncharacterized protein n=1 Tax=Fusarium napiforme TaxID=42672 RepID=A0A8H5K3X2_9HYPO|nr:hypothetical protein FNAPI_2075 [Fusarium napiforme]
MAQHLEIVALKEKIEAMAEENTYLNDQNDELVEKNGHLAIDLRGRGSLGSIPAALQSNGRYLSRTPQQAAHHPDYGVLCAGTMTNMELQAMGEEEHCPRTRRDRKGHDSPWYAKFPDADVVHNCLQT